MAQLKAARLARQQMVPQKRPVEENKEEEQSESPKKIEGHQNYGQTPVNMTLDQPTPQVEEQQGKRKRSRKHKRSKNNEDDDNDISADTTQVNQVNPDVVKQQRKERKRLKQQAKRKRNSERKAQQNA